MSIGVNVTKDNVDSLVGSLTRDVKLIMERVNDVYSFLTSEVVNDGYLTNLGYTVDDITKIRASVNDLHQLATIYSGAAALAVAKDFTTFGKYLWGTGL